MRVLPTEHERILREVHTEHADKFLGNKFEVTGLPMSMGAEGVVEFLAPWPVQALVTFRQRMTRTWIVRAAQEPTRNTLQHDFGIAVIKEAKVKPAQPNLTRCGRQEQVECRRHPQNGRRAGLKQRQRLAHGLLLLRLLVLA